MPKECEGDVRLEIVEYFTFITGLTPTESQKGFLLDIADISKKQIIATAGCQSGKTLCSAVGALWWIFESGERVNVLLVSAQDSILYYHIREIFKKHSELSQQLTSPFSPNLIPFKGFEISNGNQCFVRGSTERQLSGIPASIVVIDEACLVPNALIKEAMNRLTGPISKLIMLSTPSNPNSLFVEWATDKKSGYKVHQWVSEGLSWHDPTIDAAKKKNGRAWYAIYMLGRPPTASERAFFTSKDIDKHMIACDCSIEGGPKSTIEIGIDFGYGSPNITCLIVTEKTFSKRKMIYEKTWKDFDAEEAAKLIEGFPNALVKADSMPVEFIPKLQQYTKVKIFPVDSHYSKDPMMAQLQHRIRGPASELVIPDIFIKLKLELGLYRKGKRAGDNRVDALAIACYEPATPFKTRPVAKVYE